VSALSHIHSKLQTVLGDAGWLRNEATNGYVKDWLGLSHAEAVGVARPSNSQEVSACISICRDAGFSIVPQGGNTGMVLGSVPRDGDRNAVILSLDRMQAIDSIDAVSATVQVQAGVVLEQLQQHLSADELMIPLHLGSSGSAQIGGLIATNAGGSHAFRDGMMTDQVLGLEVVLPSGEIWQGNRALLKDNAGYPLRRLFCGSEGSLGVITAATLQAVPRPVETNTLLLSCTDINSALQLLAWCRRNAGPLLNAAEFIHRRGIDLLIKHCPEIRYPLDSVAPLSLLLEFTSPSTMIPLQALTDTALETAMTQGWVSDGVVANSEQQRKALWAIREEIPEAQRRHGWQLKHDVSVAVNRLPQFIDDAEHAVKSIMSQVIVNSFGHLADGNVHFNVSAKSGHEQQLSELAPQISNAVYDTVSTHHGSIAAEHGLGRSKVALADRLRCPVERSLMKTLKNALDPVGFMNPGVIVSTESPFND